MLAEVKERSGIDEETLQRDRGDGESSTPFSVRVARLMDRVCAQRSALPLILAW